MPTFNRAKSLRKAIEQVLAQTFSDFEFIIYNDGSTDDTVNVINSFSDTRIVFINEINKGIPHPLNGILNFARGEYIIILHDHDKFRPQLIEKSVRALDEHPEVGFVLQGCAWINSDETTGYQVFNLELPLINNGRNFGEQLLLNKTGFSSPIHACCMVRNSAYEKVGKYYNEKFGFNSDVDLWFRLLNYFNFIYLPEILFVFTGREENHLQKKNVWQITKWQHDIYLTNIEHFFENDSNKSIAIKKITKKIKKNNFINLSASLASNDIGMIHEGIAYLKNSENYVITKLILSILNKSEFTTRMITRTSSFINSLRKSFKIK